MKQALRQGKIKLNTLLSAGATAFALICAAKAASAADLVISFSQIGSEPGWRAAQTIVTKREATRRGIALKFTDAQKKQ
jgi:ABC-type sugar transport system substrate-binding protein